MERVWEITNEYMDVWIPVNLSLEKISGLTVRFAHPDIGALSHLVPTAPTKKPAKG
ncbi:hypothetical protein [Listeria rocourtiae]|uniref:hypothetical protein n=1 Tax=Listeria rocourtiae TaxID=647910 RepID=UPI003D2F5B36